MWCNKATKQPRFSMSSHDSQPPKKKRSRHHEVSYL
jgi:hypothetical protein